MRPKFLAIIIPGVLLITSCSKQYPDLQFSNGSVIQFPEADQGEIPFIKSMNGDSVGIIRPVRIEVYDQGKISTLYPPYTATEQTDEGLIATATLQIDDAILTIHDRWRVTGHLPELHRKIGVSGNSSKAFLSAVEFEFVGYDRGATEYFVPGMIYGGTGQITPEAIGGGRLYEQWDGNLWIREERMPAPLMAVRFDNKHSFSLLNISPDGRTTLEDAHDVQGLTMVDEALQFGSLFSEHQGDTLRMGYGFPGSEGSVTYQGDTYPGGQQHQWRRRYHPIEEGLQHAYSLSFNMDSSSGFREFYSAEWLNAFMKLDPEVNHQDIEQARDALLSILPGVVIREAHRTGFSNWHDATDPSDKNIDNKAVFGFTGKNLEVANYLLYHARVHPGEERAGYLDLAGEIIASFTSLKVDPPAGEGYYFKTGEPALAIPHHQQVYLRSYGDGMKALARAYILEKEYGTIHPDWLAWMSRFGNWVLEQQYPEGGFPRAWEPGTGKVSAESPASSYNLIPFLCNMYTITQEAKWLEAAQLTGEFSWGSGQKQGRFVGGTIDNPNVLDKEAGTLSAEAYLSLYEVTEDTKWLERAQAAARFAETWIYIWNVPMVGGDPDKEWADDVSTVGLQLISTGHSLVDNYMAFDVDTYAKLYSYAGDPHDFDVARLLLHNTKGMLALPGREYQYRAPGWIQEHWSLAPPRGKGLHPGWLPWVTTSNLNGICETERFDRELFESLKE
ncbi:MAG: hypothetical protein ABFS10_07125 [Bacteroidota bacterium]